MTVWNEDSAAPTVHGVIFQGDRPLAASIPGLAVIDALILPASTATRTLNVLKKSGLFDPARLARKTPNEIMRLPNCGIRTLRDGSDNLTWPHFGGR
jgi:hypothetical protein